ncbi:MAG: hypothetical protein U0694_00665 [Anaerolineae bacterium]
MPRPFSRPGWPIEAVNGLDGLLVLSLTGFAAVQHKSLQAVT